MQKILFITGKAERCGVADYGKRLFAILNKHMDIDFCEAEKESDISYEGYGIALYNYHYATLPFISSSNRNVKHIVLFHEAHMNFSPDVTVNVSDLPRPLFEGLPHYEDNSDVPVIGSFGFAVGNKNFTGLCQMVRDQFKEAYITLNIPFAEFGDKDGALAKMEVEKCREILSGSHIKLQTVHTFLSHSELLQWLSGNDINIFLYHETAGRGLASCTDYALSVKRPIGVSSSEMFRHLPKEICLDNISIPELISNGIEPLKKVYEDNSNEKLVEKIKSICR